MDWLYFYADRCRWERAEEDLQIWSQIRSLQSNQHLGLFIKSMNMCSLCENNLFFFLSAGTLPSTLDSHLTPSSPSMCLFSPSCVLRWDPNEHQTAASCAHSINTEWQQKHFSLFNHSHSEGSCCCCCQSQGWAAVWEKVKHGPFFPLHSQIMSLVSWEQHTGNSPLFQNQGQNSCTFHLMWSLEFNFKRLLRLKIIFVIIIMNKKNPKNLLPSCKIPLFF